MGWNVSRIIAVHGCKGGVGKSTVAIGVALALAERGCSVGICDLDICGPNVAPLLNVDEGHVKWRQVTVDDDSIMYDRRVSAPTEHDCDVCDRSNDLTAECEDDVFSDIAFQRPEPATTSLLQPKDVHGIKLMSFAFIKSKNELGYAAFRGPMLDQISSELVFKTDWGQLDYLVLDLPPGTGDVIISIMEDIAVSALVAVSTPHQVSIKDAVKGVRLFQDYDVPVAALVENMSYFTCDGCDKLHYLFGPSQADSLARLMGIEEFVCLPMMHAGGCLVDQLLSNTDARQKFANVAKFIEKRVRTSSARTRRTQRHGETTVSPVMRQSYGQHGVKEHNGTCSQKIEW